MKNREKAKAASKFLFFFFCFSAPLAGEWLIDFEKAKTRAVEEKKDLFIVFTGSDWSVSCQRFEAQILSQDSFQQALTRHYVLVRVDLPIRSNLPETVIATRRDLADLLQIESWPESLYLDAKGRPFYRESGVSPLKLEQYTKHVLAQRDKKKARDLSLRRLDKLSGEERAKALVAALRLLPRKTVLEFYPDEIRELEKLDPEDALGFLKQLRSDHDFYKLERSLTDLFNHRTFDEVIAKVDFYLEVHQPSGKKLQRSLSFKMKAYQNSARRKEALKVAQEIIEIDGTTSFAQSAKRLQKSK